jgi:hypothetical protein
MKCSQTRILSFAALITLASTSAFADVGMLASDKASAPQDLTPAMSPLSQDRLRELGASARDYEMRAHYGLLDANSKFAHDSDLSSQRDGMLQEILKYQAEGRMKVYKSNIEEEASHSVVAKSTLLLGTAYLFCNGKPFTTHLTQNTEITGSAKLSQGTHSLSLTQKNISPLSFSGGVGYQMDSSAIPMLDASLSKEVLPHVVASVEQRRSLAGASSAAAESTGQIRFGASF